MVEAVAGMLRERGVDVLLPGPHEEADEDTVGAHELMVVVIGRGAEARYSVWAYPLDWAQPSSLSDAQGPDPSMLLWALQILRRKVRPTAAKLAETVAGDRSRLSVLRAVNWQWARWWDDLLDAGHTAESASMLLELTVPADDRPLLLRDAAGRPAGYPGASDESRGTASAAPATVPSALECV